MKLTDKEILERINAQPHIKWNYKTIGYAKQVLCPESAGLLPGEGIVCDNRNCEKCWDLAIQEYNENNQ